MQTFVPLTDFKSCALVLDRQRLGKQRSEVLQILRALRGLRKGWVNHPAARMWRGYEGALANYGLVMCAEWTRRGYKDTCTEKITTLAQEEAPTLPPWWGQPEMHSRHRAALLAKAPEHYGRLGWSEEPRIDYLWPV